MKFPAGTETFATRIGIAHPVSAWLVRKTDWSCVCVFLGQFLEVVLCSVAEFDRLLQRA